MDCYSLFHRMGPDRVRNYRDPDNRGLPNHSISKIQSFKFLISIISFKYSFNLQSSNLQFVPNLLGKSPFIQVYDENVYPLNNIRANNIFQRSFWIVYEWTFSYEFLL